jgi:hypothetical protein
MKKQACNGANEEYIACQESIFLLPSLRFGSKLCYSL